jgi:hypothetical protein
MGVEGRPVAGPSIGIVCSDISSKRIRPICDPHHIDRNGLCVVFPYIGEARPMGVRGRHDDASNI